MHKFLRRRVSQNKVRLVEGRYDLDLTYITDKIIAMQFPAVGLEAMYRNSRNGESGVVQYLETTHGDHYRVYNLCGEKKYQYDPAVFHGKLSAYPFPDHNPAPLVIVADFIADAVGFLNESPKNVVVVHCKAGRGRTGFMVCCLLLSMRICTQAEDAIAHFSRVRTHDGKALNQPSQIRYIGYWAALLAEASAVMGDTIKSPRKALAFMSPNTRPHPMMKEFSTTKRGALDGNSPPQFRLKSYKGVPLPESDSSLFFKSLSIFNAAPDVSSMLLVLEQNGMQVHSQQLKRDAIDSFEWQALGLGLELCGDIRLEGFDDDGHNKKQLFRYWFNTHFMRGGKVRISRDEIDIACRARAHTQGDRATQVFGENTILVLDFVRDASNKENVRGSISTRFMVPTLRPPVQMSLAPARARSTEPAVPVIPVIQEEEAEVSFDSCSSLSPEELPPSPEVPDKTELTSRDRVMALYSFMRSELDELSESQQIELLQMLRRLLQTKIEEAEFVKEAPSPVSSPRESAVPGWEGKKRVTFQSAAPNFPVIGTDPFPRRRARQAMVGSMSEKSVKHVREPEAKSVKFRPRQTPWPVVEYGPGYKPLPRRTVLRCITNDGTRRALSPITPPVAVRSKRKMNEVLFLADEDEEAPKLLFEPKLTDPKDMDQDANDIRMHFEDDEEGGGELAPELLAWTTDLSVTEEHTPPESAEALQAKFTHEMEQVQRIVFRHEKASSERSSLAPLPALSVPPPTLSPATQRQIETVIRQLIANETAYAHELQMMVHHFAAPLAKIARRMTLGNHYRPGDIAPYQVEVVLCNIEEISEFHKAFLKLLVQAGKEGAGSNGVCVTPQALSLVRDVFRDHMKSLAKYARYVTNYPKCQKSLTALSRNKVFRDLVDAKRSYGVQGKDLDFYRLLLVPVPRIPYYVSVFTELLQIYNEVDPVFSDSLQLIIDQLVAVIRTFNTSGQPLDVFRFSVSRVNKFRKNTPAELEIDTTTRSLTIRNDSEEDIVLAPQAVGLKLSKNYPTKCTLAFQALRQKEAVRFMFETQSERERFERLFETHIRSALQRTPTWVGL